MPVGQCGWMATQTSGKSGHTLPETHLRNDDDFRLLSWATRQESIGLAPVHRCSAPPPSPEQVRTPQQPGVRSPRFQEGDRCHLFSVAQEAPPHVRARQPAPARRSDQGRRRSNHGTGTEPWELRILHPRTGAGPRVDTTAPPDPRLSRRPKPPAAGRDVGGLGRGGGGARIPTPSIPRWVKPADSRAQHTTREAAGKPASSGPRPRRVRGKRNSDLLPKGPPRASGWIRTHAAGPSAPGPRGDRRARAWGAGPAGPAAPDTWAGGGGRAGPPAGLSPVGGLGPAAAPRTGFRRRSSFLPCNPPSAPAGPVAPGLRATVPPRVGGRGGPRRGSQCPPSSVRGPLPLSPLPLPHWGGPRLRRGPAAGTRAHVSPGGGEVGAAQLPTPPPSPPGPGTPWGGSTRLRGASRARPPHLRQV